MLVRLKDKIKNIIYRLGPPPYCKESFSQAGEDMCINFLFNSKNINSINYLELGAYDPCSASNTYFFYKNGNNGILIEADSNRIHKIKEKRPKDKVLSFSLI